MGILKNKIKNVIMNLKKSNSTNTNIEGLYLERIISIKNKIHKISNYSAYKYLKIILTTYIKEKYSVNVKTTIGKKEQDKLIKHGCRHNELGLFNIFFNKLLSTKELPNNSDKRTIYSLYDSVIDYFSKHAIKSR